MPKNIQKYGKISKGKMPGKNPSNRVNVLFSALFL